MVTRLKNSRKTGWFLVVAVLLCCAVGMVMGYPAFDVEMQGLLEGKQVNIDMLSDFTSPLNRGNYILYNEVSGETDRAYMQEEYGEDEFYLLRKYMDYEVFSWDGEALLDSADTAVQRKLVQKDTDYMMRVKFVFAEAGELDDVQVDGTALDERAQYDLEQTILYRNQERADWEDFSSPSEVMIIYGITQENMDAYWVNYNSYTEYMNAVDLSNNSVYQGFEWVCYGVAVLMALFIPRNKKWKIGEQRIFRIPMELVLCAVIAIVSLDVTCARIVWNTMDHSLAKALMTVMGIGEPNAYFASKILNVLMWFVMFGTAFWCTVCLRAVFTMKGAYFRNRTLTGRGWNWFLKQRNRYGDKMKEGAGDVAHGAKKLWRKTKELGHNTYEGLLHIDFQDQTNRAILKIVILNFVVFSIISFLWYYGIFALIVYSVILFLFLRKYFADLRGQYQTLLESTSVLAEGNLDTPLEEDYGIFNPVGEELNRIRIGFQKAVEEEVKSERMKTELITNVSHDLKTPLTAIITYIDLLKQEEDARKQKEYIAVLERKSLRLKVLIEDLFEISKASSRNVTMNFMKVDIVGLLKQVGLEYDSKIKETNLEVKWRLPEEKLILWLDSQKTYRIFENLIVNITKYAMPHTRVYVEMKQVDERVHIMMKNVSAAELNFNTEEITDRFVRGDASRNTEGSGLGLAIAKSFTELQHGELKVSTDADLFKVEIVFPCMKEGAESIDGNEK